MLNYVLPVLIALLSLGAFHISQQPKTLHLLSDLFLDALGAIAQTFLLLLSVFLLCRDFRNQPQEIEATLS